MTSWGPFRGWTFGSAMLIFAVWISSSPALATGGVYCDGTSDDSVGAYLTVGRVPGFAVAEARITANDQSWDTSARDGAAPIVLVQGAIVGDLIVADFADPNVENVVVSLRDVRAENDHGFAAGGVLSIAGIGVWSVSCVID